MNQTNSMITINNLEKIYRTEEVETVALSKLSMEVKEGEFVAIMGPSGCGKSTLLNILGLLDDLDSGSFVFNGIEVGKFNERKRADLRKHHIGFVFQSFNLIDELTVFENVELPLIYTGVKAADRKKRVEEVLDKMQIMHRRNHYPQQLSGGQQQRVAVARAVVNRPKLILADEPTGNLDSSNGNEVMQLLTELNEQGTTVIMVTHSEHDARYSRVSSIVFIASLTCRFLDQFISIIVEQHSFAFNKRIMFRHYFKTAVRNLWKNKIFTGINLVGLVLGLSAVMVLSVMVYQFINFDSLQHDKAQMAYLKTVDKSGSEAIQTTYPLLYEALKTCPDVEAGTHLQTWYAPWLKYNEHEVQEDATYFVDSGFFSVFTFPLKYGNAKAALTEKFSIVLSEETAQKLFGREDPIGKTIAADDSTQLTVTGVLKHIPSNNSIRPNVLLTTALLNDYPGFKEDANWYNGFAQNFIRLKANADIPKLEAQLNHLVLVNYHPERKSDKIKIAAFENLPSENMGSLGKAIISGSIGTIVFILLIIIVNLVNLNAGTMFTRAKEVAVKQMLGSSKQNIIIQFCLENALVVFVSLLLAALFFYNLLVPQINTMFGNQFGEMEISFAKDYPLLLLFVGAGLLIVIIAAAYPAWHLTALKVTDTVKGKITGNNKKSITRNAFITLQFVLSMLLIYTTVILNSQVQHMKSATLGFNKDDVAVVNLDLAFKNEKTATAQFDAILNSLKNDPAIKSVSTNRVVPTAYHQNYNTYYDVTNNREVGIRHVPADAGYFATYEIPVIEGRTFKNLPDSNEMGNVIINRAAMKAFGWTSAVGKQLKQKSNTMVFTVVGVTEDFNYQSLSANVEPLLHFYDGKQSANNNYLSVLINKGHQKQVMQKIESAIKTIPARRPFSYEMMSDRVNKQYAMLDNILGMTKYTSFLTIFIACMGMLGLITLFARQRVKEIGVRKVLGASTGDIVLLLSRNFLLLATIACLIAAPLANQFMGNWLQNFAYHVSIQWWMFVAGGLGAIVIVLLTVSFQSIKAAMANPVKSLRTE